MRVNSHPRPGGISTVVIYASSSQTYIHTLSIIAASLIISIICYLTLRAGNQVSRYLGNTGMSILNRVMGLLLAVVIGFSGSNSRNLALGSLKLTSENSPWD